jgi:hypothetical protein
MVKCKKLTKMIFTMSSKSEKYLSPFLIERYFHKIISILKCFLLMQSYL